MKAIKQIESQSKRKESGDFNPFKNIELINYENKDKNNDNKTTTKKGNLLFSISILANF